jgi:RNA polymerase sigma-70 factor (ECF subfamily)
MVESEDLRDEELVGLCQGGQSQYFEPLVQRYMQKAFHIAFGFTRETESAKDLSQDAFLRLSHGLNSLMAGRVFYTWFYRILVNLCLDHARHHSKVAWESLDSLSEVPRCRAAICRHPLAAGSGSERRRGVRRASERLEAMPNKQRTAFMLRNDQGLSIADIAKVMKTTEGTVRVYLHRAVAALRQSLLEFV